MDTSWWPAAAAVVAVLLVVLVAGRLPALPRRGGSQRAFGAEPRPRPGELWCVADGRSCLVLSVEPARAHRARVAWITGKYDDRRPGVVPLPPGTVGSGGRPGFLEADRPEQVRVGELRSRLGVLDPAVWDEVKGLGGGR